MRLAVNYRRVLKQLNIIAKEVLGQTTYLGRSLPLKALDSLSRQSDGRHEAQFKFLVCTTGKKSLEESTSLQGTYLFFYDFRQ